MMIFIMKYLLFLKKNNYRQGGAQSIGASESSGASSITGTGDRGYENTLLQKIRDLELENQELTNIFNYVINKYKNDFMHKPIIKFVCNDSINYETNQTTNNDKMSFYIDTKNIECIDKKPFIKRLKQLKDEQPSDNIYLYQDTNDALYYRLFVREVQIYLNIDILIEILKYNQDVPNHFYLHKEDVDENIVLMNYSDRDIEIETNQIYSIIHRNEFLDIHKDEIFELENPFTQNTMVKFYIDNRSIEIESNEIFNFFQLDNVYETKEDLVFVEAEYLDIDETYKSIFINYNQLRESFERQDTEITLERSKEKYHMRSLGSMGIDKWRYSRQYSFYVYDII